MARLVVKSGPRAGETIELVDEAVLGRENADVTIADPEISRRHASIRPRESGVEIEDLGSKNGTWVAGVRIANVTVVTQGGTLLQVGETEIEIDLETPDADADADATRVRQRPPEQETTTVRAAVEDRAAPATRPAAPVAQPVAVAPFGAFRPPEPRRRRGAATRLWLPSVVSFAAIGGTAVALVIYFAER
jgi:hypothetical protein